MHTWKMTLATASDDDIWLVGGCTEDLGGTSAAKIINRLNITGEDYKNDLTLRCEIWFNESSPYVNSIQ